MVIEMSKTSTHLITPTEPHYGGTSDFIQQTFKDSYEATLEIHETLFSLSLSGQILAACGITQAHEQALFLEHYTGQGIERLCQTPRDRIIEISHLAGASKGVSGRLFSALTQYCHQQGISVVAFTGTASLLRSFDRFGIPLTRVCDASEDKVKHLGGQWGSYYRYKPQVAFVRVDDAINALFTKNTINQEN